MKHTLKEVKDHFKGARAIKCLFYDKWIELTEVKITRHIHELKGRFWMDYISDRPRSLLLYSEGEFAKRAATKQQISKYHVDCKGVNIDVYDVLKAFDVVNPATQHAIKKLLKGGERGFKDVNKDYQEAIDSILRAIELNELNC